MYHSVYFDSINTYSDWHLVPEGRPVIVLPELKKTEVDIPGANGNVDLSEALTGYPTYKNRSGSIKFIVLTPLNEKNLGLTPKGDWVPRYQEIATYLQGRLRTLKLEDDPDWYYYGRHNVAWTSGNDGNGSQVEVKYELEPYKYSVVETTSTYSINSETTIHLISNDARTFPVIPTINVTRLASSTLRLVYNNAELTIQDREEEIGAVVTRSLYSFPVSNMDGLNDPTIVANGDADFTITYRRAAL